MLGYFQPSLRDEEFTAAQTPHDKTVLQAQLAATDRRIDALAYEPYGLSADEIKIVEEGTGG